MRRKKNRALCFVLAACLALACACAKNPSQSELYDKLIAHFEGLGYECALSPLENDQRDVPIYQASAWQSLMLDGREEVLVYFDESNRADYLSGRIDGRRYGTVSRFGLRFVLVYEGEDQGVKDALEEMGRE